LAAGRVTAEAPLPAVVEFNRDIRPILSDNCYACHGPDKNQRKAKLQLDIEAEAMADRGGYQIIVPGKPDDSPLYQKITSDNEKKRMPPERFSKKPSPRQIALIRRWIEQGAKWQGHWSFIPPKRTEPPTTADGKWPTNAIDHFILARLEQENLKPS